MLQPPRPSLSSRGQIQTVANQGSEGMQKQTRSSQETMYAQLLNQVRLFVTPGTVTHQAQLCPWDFPGKNTGVGCHLLFHGIFLTQGRNPCLLHWQAYSWPLSHLEVQEFIQGIKRGWKALWVYSSWNINRTGWDFSNIICPPFPLVLYPDHHNSVLLILICCFLTASCIAQVL